MENTVKERVKELKNEFQLSDVEFCMKANISTATLNRLIKGETVSQKKIKAITHAFGINPNWLMTGEGEKRTSIIPQEMVRAAIEENRIWNGGKRNSNSNSIESALNSIQDMFHEQLRKKDEQIAGLMAILQKVNFLNPLAETSYLTKLG